MVAVIEPGGEDGHVGVEGVRADAHLPQLFRVLHGQARDTAEIIVDHAHIDARRSLFPQDLQDGIPHLPLRNDEKLDEDIVLGLLQLLEHGRVAAFAAREVGRVGVVIDGIAGGGEQIARMIERRGPGGRKLPEGLFLLLQLLHGDGLDRLHLPVLIARDLVAAKEQIDREPRHREGQDQHDPRDLVAGIDAARDDIDDHGPAQHVHGDADPEKIGPQIRRHDDQEPDLQQNADRDRHDPLEHQLGQIPHSAASLRVSHADFLPIL